MPRRNTWYSAAINATMGGVGIAGTRAHKGWRDGRLDVASNLFLALTVTCRGRRRRPGVLPAAV